MPTLGQNSRSNQNNHNRSSRLKQQINAISTVIVKQITQASKRAATKPSPKSTLGQNGSTISLEPISRSARRQPARQPISPNLRNQIFSLDRYRCRLCGASPTTDRNTRLHIDHIMPVSRGGTNDPTNLQTLCQSCNLAKSNRLADE